ncbi:MAG: 2-hydroxychromene-2-carboxylate isomerase [Steroidobacteraceae bacterium]
MGERLKVVWVYDVISPFAYLALPRLGEFPETVELTAMPVLFAALLDHFGQRGPAEIPSKRRFTYRFALWRARRLQLPMQFPPAHPFNPLAALRLIIAAGSTLHAARTVLTAVFGAGRDVSDPRVVAQLAQELGVANPEQALADPEVKARLRQNTQWASERGVFGVPTLVIGQELFWGHDAIDMALDYLKNPRDFSDAAMRAIDQLPIAAARVPKAS